MKMSAGVWIGLVLGAVGFLVGMGAVVMTSGSSGIYITAGLIILFTGVFYLVYRVFLKPMINANRLQKTGLPGTARILEVKDTGVTINNNPQVKLILEVKNSLGQKYNSQCRVLVSRINPWAYQPGMEVPVKIDPNNEQNVVLDFTGNTNTRNSQQMAQQGNNMNTAALTQELEKMQQENNAILASGREARAIIKKYTWLGAYVNGKNPWVELELEVLPENSAAFGGKTRAVIAETSVQKYQPGQEIFVKYDLYDNSRVVILHS